MRQWPVHLESRRLLAWCPTTEVGEIRLCACRWRNPPEPGADQSDMPPALGSEDLARVLEVQRERTPKKVSRARGDVQKSVFRFSDVLDAAFNENNFPKTTALFVAHQCD
jgi:hypothetical protein